MSIGTASNFKVGDVLINGQSNQRVAKRPVTIDIGGGAPIILSVSPESGTSGTLVTITGVNFTGVTSVTFDDVSAIFTVVSDTTITATVP